MCRLMRIEETPAATNGAEGSLELSAADQAGLTLTGTSRSREPVVGREVAADAQHAGAVPEPPELQRPVWPASISTTTSGMTGR